MGRCKLCGGAWRQGRCANRTGGCPNAFRVRNRDRNPWPWRLQASSSSRGPQEGLEQQHEGLVEPLDHEGMVEFGGVAHHEGLVGDWEH